MRWRRVCAGVGYALATRPSAWRSGMQNLEGQELGGVKLIRKIGEGGMGEVYLGEQIGVGNRLVAVKIVRPGDGSLPANASADIERRFKREAAILGKFNHPNI